MNEATCTRCHIRYRWEKDRSRPFTRARCVVCGQPLKRVQAVYELSPDQPVFEERSR